MSEATLRRLALQVRIVGAHGAVDARAAFRTPFHICAIPNMGLTLGEIFFLEDLAADSAADGRYPFLLVAPRLLVTGGVGTPINPYALK